MSTWNVNVKGCYGILIPREHVQKSLGIIEPDDEGLPYYMDHHEDVIGKEEEEIICSQAGSFQVFSIRNSLYLFSTGQPVEMANWYLAGSKGMGIQVHEVSFNVNIQQNSIAGNEMSTVDQELLKIAKHFKPLNQRMSFPPGFYTFCWNLYDGYEDLREITSKNDENGNNQKNTENEGEDEFEYNGGRAFSYEYDSEATDNKFRLQLYPG